MFLTTAMKKNKLHVTIKIGPLKTYRLMSKKNQAAAWKFTKNAIKLS